MKKIFFILCLFCVILLPVSVSAVGNISVSSTPSGSLVYLDGTSTGTTTPAKIEGVTIGSHIVLLRLTGYQDYTQSVIVSDNTTSMVSATLTSTLTTTTTEAITNGSIYIESNPSNAAVFLNTVYQGKTPVTLYNITRGDYRVVVQKTGYQDWSTRIFVSLGTRSDIYATLNPEVTDTTIVTTIPTATILKTTTTIKSTIKVPTPWPSATATPASPVSILAILGAVGVGLIVLRKE
jgi:serine protease